MIDRIRASRAIKFGVPFKHNTGRAVCYFYSYQYLTDSQMSETIPFLEAWHVCDMEKWNRTKYVEITNLNNVVFQKYSEWDVTQTLGSVRCDRVVKFQYVSLTVRFNYEFHIRLTH